MDVTTYTVLVLEKNSVQINDLLPGTKYAFRVHTLTAEGHPSSHSAELEFETLALGECVRMRVWAFCFSLLMLSCIKVRNLDAFVIGCRWCANVCQYE